MPFLLTAYYLLLSILALRRLPLAIALTVFALPSYLIRFSIGPIPTTLLEGMILVITGVWIIQKKSENRDWRLIIKSLISNIQYPIAVGVFLFLAASIISLFIAPDFRVALGLWRAYILEPLLFFIVFLDTARREPKTIPYTIFALAAAAFLLSLLALYQFFAGWMVPKPWNLLEYRRATGVFPYPNALGLFLAPLTVLLFGFAIQQKKYATCYMLHATCFLSSAAILAAKSHGAIAGVIVGLVILGVIHRHFRITTLIVILTSAFLIVAYTPWRNYATDRLSFTSPSGRVRISQYKDTFRMLADGRWITGSGFGGYKKTVAPYHRRKDFEIFQYPHNIFLAIWTELGLLGLVSFLWLIVVVCTIAIKRIVIRHSSFVIPALAALATLLIHGLVDVPFFKNDLAVLFWIIVGIILISSHATSPSPSPDRRGLG